MSGDTTALCSSSNDHAAATVAVLTQPHLLALVVSFQRGLPVSTGPLILQYLTTHLQHDAASPRVTAESIYDLWATPSVLVATHRWRQRATMYSMVMDILKRDPNDDNAAQLRELRFAFVCASRCARPVHAQRLLLLRARATAAALGRDDVLVWLDAHYGRVRDRDPTLTRFPTPLNARVVSGGNWRARVAMEAVVSLDDSATFDALRLLLRGCAFQRKPEQALRRCVHRAWEAAAVQGRVDVLAYLDATDANDAVAPIRASLCRSAAALAVRHGHVLVLAWLETTFGISAVAKRLRGYKMKGVVGRGHREVVRWMAQRALGDMPIGAAFVALAQRDLAMLCAVLTRLRPRVIESHGLALVRRATVTGQNDAVLRLIEHNAAFPLACAHEAIARRDLDALAWMLDKLQNTHPDVSGCLVSQLVRNNDTRVLAMLESRVPSDVLQLQLRATVLLWAHTADTSDETMRLLLRLSPVADITTVLMTHAIRGETAPVETLLRLIECALPSDVVGIVHRVTTDALGPVASLAHACWLRPGDNGYPIGDAHLVETMAHWMPTATRQDTRDLVLHLLPLGMQAALERVLVVDADRAAPHCGPEFLELCLTLRQTIHTTEHRGLAAILRPRRRQQQQEEQTSR